MKFDFVIGNPPYQEESKGNKTADVSIYHHFMNAAFDIGSKVELITPARFLFNAGSTPKQWNTKMLNDERFKVLRYAQNSETLFPRIGIAGGGVAISYRDCTRTLGPIIRFIIHKELASSLDKVLRRCEKSLSEFIYNENKFNLQNLYLSYPKLKAIISSEGRERRITSGCLEYDCFHVQKNKNTDICVLGVINNKRVQRYISEQFIELSHENLAKYKVIVPGSGPGAIGEVLATPLIGEPLIGEPLIGHSQTFIGIGSFENKKEAENCLKYIKSKFARAMLGILKVTQSSRKETWQYVPWQDFSDKSDINWNTAVEDIDKQLYKKYELNDGEIAFINKNVKIMI